MRAKRVMATRAFFFDFDDTLVLTKGSVKVRDIHGNLIKHLTPDEFSIFKKTDDEVLDFEDFISRDIILDAEPYKMWPLLKQIDYEIKHENNDVDLYILTARTNHVQLAIFDLFKSWGIDNLFLHNIICIGDGRGEINISKEKKKILKEKLKIYDNIWFFDDDDKNIEVTKGLKNIKTKLVENNI